MPQRIAKNTIFLNADKTKAVSEDSPDAAFLFVREGSAVNESEAKRLEGLGVKLDLTTGENPDFDARAAHEAQYGPPNAQREAERDAAAASTDTKAVTAAPANKAKQAPAEDK